MNKIDQKFQELKQEQKKAFIGFLTAGDPDIETCKSCIYQMAKNGCDLIEIGIPFSDPAADGPLIQQASLRALNNGIRTDDIMAMVKDIRTTVKIPMVYLLYYNQIFTYGVDKFLNACVDCGIDGLIIPDLPYEHQDEIQPLAEAKGLYLISLITPISAKRQEKIAKDSKGFLYCVTSLGVTGERAQFQMDLKNFIKELNQYSDTPKALGFGISTTEQIKELRNYADGVIVGSAIVRQIAKLVTKENTLEDVGAFVKILADACHNG